MKNLRREPGRRRTIIIRLAPLPQKARRRGISHPLSTYAALIIVSATIASAPLSANEVTYSPPATVHLSTASFPSGVENEQGYAEWLADRAKQLQKKAGDAKEAEQSLELRLAAINWVLASQCEPAMSRWLHGIATPADHELINDLTRQGLEELQDARADMERFTEIPEHDQDTADRFDSSIELLEGFAKALSACILQESEPNARSVYRDASSQLSIYLEDDRPQVAAAAKLWQAVLYQKSDRIDRSLRMLSLPSEPPADRTMQYDFFGRLLRCRHLARRQSFGAAWSLLLTLEERSQDWFVTLRARADASRTTALARLALCDEWSKSTGEKPDHTTKTWCDKLTEKLRASYLPPDGDHSVIRLATAAPTVMEIPNLEESEVPGSPDVSGAQPDDKDEPSKKDDIPLEADPANTQDQPDAQPR